MGEATAGIYHRRCDVRPAGRGGAGPAARPSFGWFGSVWRGCARRNQPAQAASRAACSHSSTDDRLVSIHSAA